ncbi:MAG: hypothetical protein A2W61_04030 [Deltaproteobacteria bacterium RIFCSPLOWO2_01_44_7]|nr:MAG: hypothetical protein A2712_01780 [Deltaproteobacteria bacterium RIFCSPHIGHO2_01_FULL_43_49]OGQ15143.1 MAG: hypothetical protein A3D22_03695 [Deltaproteobacteria bacterium RIFCSPHIGHO2_02_FULL_44_53]OGQ27236.1 MAG: hypothetical protein A3D98_02375 [Deltaproteobacteria bacterium RIFCSPHIGHO2_12_FULL_44_21]OGQ31660.1 MAG: hypothetical protein A2979_04855 [Deltaproteobacteria bacterium RIFCSPLOWO2_01_FULL_45_74]OGQ42860.1 MAG: hypothetical protein A3I70_07160 [Deltaproteobacteria bacterium 
MRIKHSQIAGLARHIVKSLQQKKVATFGIPDDQLASLLVEVFEKNEAEEEKLNEDAKRLLEQNKKKIGLQIDEEKAFGMIKKQLAKERNFVL